MGWKRILQLFGDDKRSVAVDAPADAIRVTNEPNHPNTDDGHSAVSSASSVLMPVAFQSAKPNPVRKLPLLDRSKGKAAQEPDAQSTSVDAQLASVDAQSTSVNAAPTTTKDEVQNDTPIDEGNHLVNVENKKEKKEPYIRVEMKWEWEILDGALEYAALDIESECIPKKGPAAKFMAMAKAKGFKVRNVPAKHRELATKEYEHELDVDNSSILDVLPAHMKALDHHYTRSHHVKKYGTWGMKYLGNDDAEVVKTVEERDESFVSPEYVAYEPFVAEADIPPAPSQQNLVTPPSSPTRGRSADTGTKGKGKKRERPPSAIPRLGPSGSRRTRSRITVDNELSKESESKLMSSPRAVRSRRRLSKPKPKPKRKSRPIANPSSEDQYSGDPDPALQLPWVVGAPRPSKPRHKTILKPTSEEEFSSDPEQALLSPWAVGSRHRLSRPHPTPTISMPSATEPSPGLSNKYKRREKEKRAHDENEHEEPHYEDGPSLAKKVKGESAHNHLVGLPSDQPNLRRPLQHERRKRLDRRGFFHKLDEHDPFRAHGLCFPGTNQDNADMGPAVCPPLVRRPSMDINVETIAMREGSNTQVGSSSIYTNHPVQRQPRTNNDRNALNSDLTLPQYTNALHLYNMDPAF